MWRRFRKGKVRTEIFPDEIFIDSSNLPAFDRDQFEGRLERPLGRHSFIAIGGAVALLMIALIARAAELQIVRGAAYAARAEQNQLTESTIFADRGVIVDRRGVELAYNERASVEDDYAQRRYAPLRGISHVVGYVKPPARDASGNYYRTSFTGVDGVERAYDGLLAGQGGLTLTETDARGDVVSHAVVRPAAPGTKLALSLDAQVTEGLYDAIADVAEDSGFQGGSGVVIDVETGEILALTNYPEYSSEALSTGESETVEALLADERQPFLNRAMSGLYAPGSIVKPFVAAGALTAGVIDEYTKILSTGSITIPNPYNPDLPSVYKDWRAHGWVDMREALAVSSDVYFYEVGGGFESQPGLGIERLDHYFKLFGFGGPTGLAGFPEAAGTIPTPAWKEEHFPGDPWRVGNTYHTAIGQYGMQVTTLQAARAVAAIANGGTLLTPTLIGSSTPAGAPLFLPAHALEVVREGMRMAVRTGTAVALNRTFVEVAGKTGTAQVGARNQYVNSSVIGFFPYEHPRYAFAVVMEKAPAGTPVGAPAVMGRFFDWLYASAPEYLE